MLSPYRETEQENGQLGEEMEFGKVIQTLGIHVVGVHGLPYPQMLERVEKITYFGQVRSRSHARALAVSFPHALMHEITNARAHSLTHSRVHVLTC